MDASIRDLAVHRMGQVRTDDLLSDMADGVEDATYRLAEGMGALTAIDPDARLAMRVPVARGLTWTGTRLLVTVEMPETLVVGMVGRRLRDVIDHPALPGGRIVLEVHSLNEGHVLTFEPDDRPICDLVRRRRAWPIRWARRRQETVPAGATPHVAGIPVVAIAAYAAIPATAWALGRFAPGIASHHLVGITLAVMAVAVLVHGGAERRDMMNHMDNRLAWRNRLDDAHAKLLAAMDQDPAAAL
jgi:hypothetical protein